MNELQNYVNAIAHDIFKLYDGLDLAEDEREEMEEAGEPVYLYDYFNDALDVEYSIGGNGDFRGVRIAVTLGGPNVYVDTRRGCVEGFWGTDHAEKWVPSEICEEINIIFEDIYLSTVSH